MARALRHRNFRLFWFGQLISLIGTWMQALALQWLVYTLTGSALAMGTVAALTALPVLVLGLFAGVIVDRYSRQGVIIATQTAAMLLAFVLAALTFSGHVQYWHVLMLALGSGLVNALDMPARQAFLVEMVPEREDLLNAIALNSSVFNAARVVGPAVAGVLVGLVGLGWAFMINGVSFLAVISGLLMMRNLPPRSQDNRSSTPVRSFVEGFRYAMNTPMIRTVLLLVLIPSILSFSYVTVLPIFADQILVTSSISAGATRLGVILMANGVGALAGALRVAAMSGDSDRRRYLVQGGIGFGVGQILFALNPSFWLALPIMVITGFSMITFLANANATLQTTAADLMRGRVMSFYVTVLVGLGMVGSLEAGWVAEHWGATAVTIIGGTACLLTTLAASRSRVMRSKSI